jgi:hypothetical protein
VVSAVNVCAEKHFMTTSLYVVIAQICEHSLPDVLVTDEHSICSRCREPILISATKSMPALKTVTLVTG